MGPLLHFFIDRVEDHVFQEGNDGNRFELAALLSGVGILIAAKRIKNLEE